MSNGRDDEDGAIDDDEGLEELPSPATPPTLAHGVQRPEIVVDCERAVDPVESDDEGNVFDDACGATATGKQSDGTTHEPGRSDRRVIDYRREDGRFKIFGSHVTSSNYYMPFFPTLLSVPTFKNRLLSSFLEHL
jgi:hypothetical protein